MFMPLSFQSQLFPCRENNIPIRKDHIPGMTCNFKLKQVLGLVSQGVWTQQPSWLMVVERRKVTLMLPPVWILALLHFRVGSSLYVITKRGVQKLECFQRQLPPFKGEHLEQGQRSSHMVGCKYTLHLVTPTMIGWTTCGRGHQNLSARKVTHPSSIPALGG